MSASTDAEPAVDGLVSAKYIQQMWLLRCVNRTILAPFDRVKYIMQCQKEMQRLGTLRVELRTSRDCVRHLMKLEGARSFWRGNLVQVISLLPITLAQIFIGNPTYAFLFNLSSRTHNAVLYTIMNYVAFVGAALAVGMVTYPLDFVRFRLAVDMKAYKGAPYEFKHALAFFSHPVLNESPHYLYRGLALFILGSILFGSVRNVLLDLVGPFVPPEQIASNNNTTSNNNEKNENENNNNNNNNNNTTDWRAIAIQTGVGVGVASVATLCLHPVDLVRRRLMITVTDDRLRYTSAWQCARRIAQREGLRGFYRGGCMSLVRMLVGTGLAMCSLPY